MDVKQIIIACVIILVCVALFIFSYLLNKKTPKPEGCENEGIECEGCQMTSCSHHVNINERKE
ncbi:MAG: hypothetical protein MR270_05220 [Erysipelotrichaceae bacterium]|nr:hypothetical protein [Erysipelotrichaceae bacterium]